ncbi:hypothetical protein E3Z29_04910 [Pseudomonas sp. S150]|nr:hypothetical protein E3Z29_04910 [Pseudomonas sp. S150]
MPAISLNQHRSPVGAGLLAKGSCQSTLISFDPPHSRASPLPQGIGGEFERVVCSRMRRFSKVFSTGKVGQI